MRPLKLTCAHLFREPALQQVRERIAHIYGREDAHHMMVLHDHGGAIFLRCHLAYDFVERRVGRDRVDLAAHRVFDEHLGVCPACVRYLEEYREVVRLGRACGEEHDAAAEAPEELVQAILAARR